MYQAVIENLRKEGAQAVILGCTEIGLLIKPEDCRIPSYDTTYLHALGRGGVGIKITLGT